VRGPVLGLVLLAAGLALWPALRRAAEPGALAAVVHLQLSGRGSVSTAELLNFTH